MKLMGTSKLRALIDENAKSAGEIGAFVAELADAQFESQAEFLERYPLATAKGAQMRIPLTDDFMVEMFIKFDVGMILIDRTVARDSVQPRRTKNARAA
ncbi:hypothetical protein F3X89_13400 [Rhizobium rhizogenes]|uniref:hypothetical protein n=1 Tax=Rhizobium rhizogenes TaxID=359 RepID=UPI00193D966E|nr:hypothetical protein [Rhizobium rhizogenes]QRM38750.1 hypothetical protein F3X89_13400 [Rhizobium rhizogenes]